MWTGRPGSRSGPWSSRACSAAPARSCRWPTPPSAATSSGSPTRPRWSATAPRLEQDAELSEEDEARLYAHYGIQYTTDESSSGLPVGVPGSPDGGTAPAATDATTELPPASSRLQADAPAAAGVDWGTGQTVTTPGDDAAGGGRRKQAAAAGIGAVALAAAGAGVAAQRRRRRRRRAWANGSARPAARPSTRWQAPRRSAARPSP